jgi:ABC-type glutathione transport system ATPase component
MMIEPPPTIPATVIAEVRNLRAYYLTSTSNVQRTVRAVDDISLQIQEGEVYGIAGESGCGKTTLLKVLLGMITPPLTIVGGSLHYRVEGRDVDVLALSDEERRAMRWKVVSYIPQGSMHVLNPVSKISDTFRDFTALGRPDRAARARLPGRAGPAGNGSRRLPAPAFGGHAPARDHRPGDHSFAAAGARR